MRPEPISSPGLPASPGTRAAADKRTGARSAVARPRAVRCTSELEREILTGIARGGLLICETELRYQLTRRDHDRPDLLELLAELERRGLIESEIHFRLTAHGAARVPARDRPAPRAISSIRWTGGALLRRRQRRRDPRWPRPVTQKRQPVRHGHDTLTS